MTSDWVAPAKTALALALISGAALGWMLWIARSTSTEVERCTAGLIQMGPRCCAPGQALVRHICSGRPERCPKGMTLLENGCSAPNRLLSYSGGDLTVAPVDWDSDQIVSAAHLAVGPFRMDSHEVTSSRYQSCIDSGACLPLTLPEEPGVPVTNLPLERATRFCAASGGRLPTPEEWMFATMGPRARRYPWGAHGLSCRRVTYGLTEGPCEKGGSRPELAGARREGSSEEGAFDLVGNVAELTRDAAGRLFSVGGSFRSRFPSQVKSWAKTPDSGAPRVDLGFRCAYPPASR